MKTSFIDFPATDGIKLQGLLFESETDSNTVVLHIHGMAGSFYENSFIPVMAESYTKAGVSFLAFNNRGHDYLCDLERMTPDGVASVMGGAAYELIEDSLFDIEGAIAYVRKLGFSRIVLQGHSLGTNKIIYSLSQKSIDAAGIVLLSPCDNFGLHISEVGKKRSELVKLAELHISKGNSETLMPENIFFDYLLSARTYLGCFRDGSPLDTFPYHDSNNNFSMFKKAEVPIFIAFGTDGEYLLQTPDEVHRILEQKKSPKATISFNVIKGAPHSYTGKEKIVTEKIINWVGMLDG